MQLSLLVEEIRRQDVVSTSAAIAANVLRAKQTLEKLNGLIETKLIKNVLGTSRVRSRVWAQNRCKINKIQTELQECRANLTAMMSTLGT